MATNRCLTVAGEHRSITSSMYAATVSGFAGSAQEVIVCGWKTRELEALTASQLSSFVVGADPNSALSDVFDGPTGLVRRCRKQNGATFSPADIDRLASMALDDFVASVLTEPDHPYRAMFSHHDRGPPIVHAADGWEWTPDPAIEWQGRIIIVDDEIFVPTLTPTLAVSLDQERGRLIATASCPPMASPALRMPTIHLPYETDTATLAALARGLGVGLEFAPKPEISPACCAATNQWIKKTLADLYLYLVRKGVRRWPENLAFDALKRVYKVVSYSTMDSPPLDWFGEFLETRSDRFAHLATYIQGLQDLILARYRVIEDDLPPLPSDALTGLRF